MVKSDDLKSLLDLADIAWSAHRGDDPAAVQARRDDAVAGIRRILRDVKRRGGPGLLGDLMKKHAFTQKEGMVLLMLLKRRVSSADPFLTGQRILRRLNGGSWAILRDTPLLRPDGRLRHTQVVVPRDENSDPEDLLGAEFTLSAWAFRALTSAAASKRRRAAPKPARPYRRSEEVLLDYLRVVSLLQKRANSLFEIEDWEEVAPPGEVPARHIQAQIEEQRRTMRERLDRTDRSVHLAPVRFIEHHGLSEAETLIVMALLFQELFEGEPHASAVELLKLVSRSQRDYLRNLGLFDEERRLVKEGLVAIHHAEPGRVFSADVALESWVVPAIIHGTKRGGGFSVDAWKRFRRYLQELDDSDTFFRDLNAKKNSPKK